MDRCAIPESCSDAHRSRPLLTTLRGAIFVRRDDGLHTFPVECDVRPSAEAVGYAAAKLLSVDDRINIVCVIVQTEADVTVLSGFFAMKDMAQDVTIISAEQEQAHFLSSATLHSALVVELTTTVLDEHFPLSPQLLPGLSWEKNKGMLLDLLFQLIGPLRSVLKLHTGEYCAAMLVDRRSGRVVSWAVNTTVQSCDPTRHAEVNVLMAAAAQGVPFDGPSLALITTLQPCSFCQACIQRAAIGEVFYAQLDHRQPQPRGFTKIPHHVGDALDAARSQWDRRIDNITRELHDERYLALLQECCNNSVDSLMEKLIHPLPFPWSEIK